MFPAHVKGYFQRWEMPPLLGRAAVYREAHLCTSLAQISTCRVKKESLQLVLREAEMHEAELQLCVNIQTRLHCFS